MKVSEKDYVRFISEGERPKSYLARVERVTSTGYLLRMEKDVHFNPKTVEVQDKHIVANYGPKPSPHIGKGFDALYLKPIAFALGELHLFGAQDKEKLVALRDSGTRTLSKLEKLGIEEVIANIIFESRPSHGKYSGFYQRSKDVDKRPHVIGLYLNTPVDSFDYVLGHEVGHAIHRQVIQPEFPQLDAKWLRIYNRTVKPQVVSEEELAGLKESFRGSKAAKLSEWMSELDEDTKPKGLTVLRWLAKHRSLARGELELLLSEGDFEEIEKAWPVSAIEAKRDLKPVVSEYATLKYSELVAESIAFHLIGKELPKVIKELVVTCLTATRDFYKATGTATAEE